MAISVEEALEKIYSRVTPKSIELIPLEEALGRIASHELIATHNLPPFDNSAMDGYAITMSDVGKTVSVIETIYAGDNKTVTIQEAQCTKIMTGARIPDGCEAVVPQEDVKVTEDGVCLPQHIRQAQHIRRCGEDILKDDILLKANTRLYAHHITLLASQGISHIHVFKRPRVAIFASGSELKMHYEKVEAHQLYNTNSPTFLARAKELGCEVSFIGTSGDTLEAIKEHVAAALDADLIITSGGVSVGDADFTKEAFNAFGFQKIFDKINIKPGKPTTFGMINETLILNLPGNPLAAAMNFELFGQSIILALSGDTKKYLGVLHVKLKDDFKTKAGRRALVPGFYNGEDFDVCKKFAPGMVSPLATSNGFMMIDESVAELKAGTTVKMVPTQFTLYTTQQHNLVSYA
jgi:molybdopterin molybdotransferase